MVDKNENYDSEETHLSNRVVTKLLVDMIEESRANGGEQALFLLVLDQFTVKIISSFLKMSDLLGIGLVSVEKLEISRQRFPNYQAIYFISPVQSSVEEIAKDFKDQKKPLYGKIHIYFSHKVSDSVLDTLVTPQCLSRIKTCKELNISFLKRGLNLFDLGMRSSFGIFACRDNESNREKILEEMSDRLLTVMAVLKEHPFVQHQKNSLICKGLSELISNKLETFFNQKIANENRGVLVIVDRTIDKSAPFLFDFSYESMVYDLFKVNSENIINIDNDKKNANHVIDESDSLWEHYRTNHIVSAMNDIQNDLQAFNQSDTAKMISKKNYESAEEMSKVIRGLKGYQDKTKEFSTHLSIHEKFNEKYKELNLAEIIDVQQEIVTGLEPNLSQAKNKNTLNKVYMVLTKCSEDLIPKIVSLIPINMDLTEQKFNIIVENKLSDSVMKSILNMKWLGVDFTGLSQNNYKEHSISNDEIESVKLRKSSVKYKILTSQPKLSKIAEQASNFKLPKSEFTFVEEPDSKFKKGKGVCRIGGGDEGDDVSHLIVFVIGGVTRSEIANMERVHREKKLAHKLIIGSTSVINNTEEYLDLLASLPSNKSEIFEVKGLNKMD